MLVGGSGCSIPGTIVMRVWSQDHTAALRIVWGDYAVMVDADAVEDGDRFDKGALRSLKRKISDTLYERMLNDTHRRKDPGGHSGNEAVSSVRLTPRNVGSSDKPLPGQHPL
jgi:hypothetical protein